jgi:hypothetical protein
VANYFARVGVSAGRRAGLKVGKARDYLIARYGTVGPLKNRERGAERVYAGDSS